jgi:type II secretory pathway pseudopilin PulG
MKTAAPHTLHLLRSKQGFSFFEMMMFVAILGIIVAILVPLWGNNDAFYAARDRRNAQELVSINTMASAAGLNFVMDEKGQAREDLLEILHDISQGDSVKRGALKGRHYSVPGLSNEDIAGAANYITIENGELRYSFERKPVTRGGGSL